MQMQDSYTDAIKSEMLKGRSFDEILNEDPPEDCTSDELHAWLDAGEIAGLHENIVDNFTSGGARSGGASSAGARKLDLLSM